MIQPSFTLGLLVGFLVATPAFASRRLAAGLLLQISIALSTTALISGFDCMRSALVRFITEAQQSADLVCGLLIGVMVAGLLTTLFRKLHSDK
ncbi:MAG: hypothetical protein WAW96_12925 [Alphaproteobacteria bacterium]